MIKDRPTLMMFTELFFSSAPTYILKSRASSYEWTVARTVVRFQELFSCPPVTVQPPHISISC